MLLYLPHIDEFSRVFWSESSGFAALVLVLDAVKALVKQLGKDESIPLWKDSSVLSLVEGSLVGLILVVLLILENYRIDLFMHCEHSLALTRII